MKAIFTKGRDGTYTATDGDGNRATVRTESGMQLEEKHQAALRALCGKMGWSGKLIGGYVLQSGRTVSRVWLWDDSRALRLDIPFQPVPPVSHGTPTGLTRDSGSVKW